MVRHSYASDQKRTRPLSDSPKMKLKFDAKLMLWVPCKKCLLQKVTAV